MKIRHPVTPSHSVLGGILPRSQEEEEGVCAHMRDKRECEGVHMCLCVCVREWGSVLI